MINRVRQFFGQFAIYLLERGEWVGLLTVVLVFREPFCSGAAIWPLLDCMLVGHYGAEQAWGGCGPWTCATPTGMRDPISCAARYRWLGAHVAHGASNARRNLHR